MTAITTNVGAGFIMEKKLVCVCVCIVVNVSLCFKGFGEWDGPVTEEMEWRNIKPALSNKSVSLTKQSKKYINKQLKKI